MNRIIFKIKIGYKLELLTKETMQLLGSSKKEIDQEKDGELAPKIDNVDVFFIHLMLLIILINKNKEYCILLCQINNMVY